MLGSINVQEIEQSGAMKSWKVFLCPVRPACWIYKLWDGLGKFDASIQYIDFFTEEHIFDFEKVNALNWDNELEE